MAYGLLPGLALHIRGSRGFFEVTGSWRARRSYTGQMVAAREKDKGIALLSYESDSMEKGLEAAKNRMTRRVQGVLSQLINDVVIPSTKKGNTSTTATRARRGLGFGDSQPHGDLLFVDQTTVHDKDRPTDSV